MNDRLDAPCYCQPHRPFDFIIHPPPVRGSVELDLPYASWFHDVARTSQARPIYDSKIDNQEADPGQISSCPRAPPGKRSTLL
jgi:hypothetical protein